MQRRAALTLAALGICFWALYFVTGCRVGAHGLFHNDVFFHSDTERVVYDLAVYDVSHRRTNVHPLFVLLTNPAGLALSHFFGSKLMGAVFLNSLAGGAAVGLAGWFLQAAGVPLRRSCLFATILGCSSAHLFFGSVPETYSFSGLSIVLLFYGTQSAPGKLRYFVPAGLVSFGVLITNLGFGGIAFAASLWPRISRGRLLARTAIFLSIVVAFGAALACGQKALWPRTVLFFNPVNLQDERRFVQVPSKEHHLGQRVALLSRHMFVFDWVTPPLNAQPNEKHGIKVAFDYHSLGRLSRSGKLAAGLCMACLILAAFGFLHGRQFARPVPLAIVLGLLFNFVLHSLYGDDLFLYACNSCFLVLAWVALSTARLPLLAKFPLAIDALLLAFFVFECVNNWSFLHRLATFQVE